MLGFLSVCDSLCHSQGLDSSSNEGPGVPRARKLAVRHPLIAFSRARDDAVVDRKQNTASPPPALRLSRPRYGASFEREIEHLVRNRGADLFGASLAQNLRH